MTVVFIVFGLILSPFLLRLLPDKPKRKRPASPEPDPSFCEVLEDVTETDDDTDDDSSTFCDDSEIEYIPTEKERKEEFMRYQAECEVHHLIRTLDNLIEDYHSTKEDIKILKDKISITKDPREAKKLSSLLRDLEKSKKHLGVVDEKIYATEKKLRAAQFKAGMEITC